MNFLALLLAYVVGSIPSAFLIGKFVGGLDIRKHGSGNVGATNVFRVMGKKWGVVALILDMAKGFVPTFFLPDFFGESGNIPFRLILGLAAIIGHTFPVWLKFKGGKGVATSCGAFLGIYPKAVLAALAVWIICAFITKYVSVSSIAAAASFILWLFLFYRDALSKTVFNMTLTIGILLCGFIIWTHRTNISRLRAGTESKIGSPRPTSNK